ncbi:MAG TPA: CRISPR system precrRNA processing endoribonuclease RAMP protein Cas6 [Bryobacteraceae bacterium]|nr:CRISPR system precrRNA processing endoribonuclease RAMP protein Cas6 [Bryobacteraceae bacterium]
MHLFDTGAAPLEPLEKAFRAIAHAGIGPGRAKAALRAFEPQPIRRLPLRGTPAEGRLVVRFVTPTELKGRGAVRLEPAFPLLMERLVERVWILGRFYQHWPAWDRDILLREAARVQLVNWQWRYEHRQRRSSRTGQTHPLGGFMGTATYEGPLGIFVPLLEIGRWTGVGRQTVWGKGEIQVEPPQPYLFSRESAGQRSSQSPVLATVRPAPDAASG